MDSRGSDPSREIETRWLADSLRLTWREIRSFAATAAAATVRPARFAGQWVHGERPAMNPLGYFATSAAIVAVYRKIAFAVVGTETDEGLGAEILDAVGPYLHYVALGLLSHAVLRLRGSRRTLRGTLALSLYVGGGPGALVTVLNISMFVFTNLVWGKSNFAASEVLSPSVMTLAVLVFATRLGFMVIFVRALSGFHAARTGWTLLAFLLALTSTALAFGLLDPPGSYGGHFVIGSLDDGERIWWPIYAF
jgi:hypothetical protein